MATGPSGTDDLNTFRLEGTRVPNPSWDDDSEQRRALLFLVATRYLVGHIAASAKYDDTPGGLCSVERQAPQRLIGPRSTTGGFADHHYAAGLQVAASILQRGRRGSEPSGNDEVELRSIDLLPGQDLGSTNSNRRSVGDSQFNGGPVEKCAPLGGRIEQDRFEVRPSVKDHEAGNAAARSEIDHAPSAGRDRIEVLSGVFDVGANRARTEETHGPGPMQDGLESRCHDQVSVRL